jgi:hypothetical protein
MAHGVEYLPNKWKTLNSNLSSKQSKQKLTKPKFYSHYNSSKVQPSFHQQLVWSCYTLVWFVPQWFTYWSAVWWGWDRGTFQSWGLVGGDWVISLHPMLSFWGEVDDGMSVRSPGIAVVPTCMACCAVSLASFLFPCHRTSPFLSLPHTRTPATWHTQPWGPQQSWANATPCCLTSENCESTNPFSLKVPNVSLFFLGDRVSLCSPGWSGAQNSSCLSLQSAGIIAMCHHTWLTSGILLQHNKID